MILNFLVTLNAMLQKAKINLPGVVKLVAVAIKLSAEAVLKDGTKIYTTADAWAVGVDAYTQDADGNPQPLAAGSYELEDGSTVIVGDDMMVAEIKAAETPPPAELTAEQLQAIATETANALVAETTAHTATKAELTAAKADVVKIKAELAAANKKIVALGKAPATGDLKSEVVKLSKEDGTKMTVAQKVVAAMDAANS